MQKSSCKKIYNIYTKTVPQIIEVLFFFFFNLQETHPPLEGLRVLRVVNYQHWGDTRRGAFPAYFLSAGAAAGAAGASSP